LLYADKYGDVYQVPLSKISDHLTEEKIPTEEYKYGFEAKPYISALIFGHQETIEHIDVTPGEAYIITIDFANKIKVTHTNTPTKIHSILFALK
jgi:hypothetical protein